jgi:tetrahydromethanopterin S-methyltransferase subunit G
MEKKVAPKISKSKPKSLDKPEVKLEDFADQTQEIAEKPIKKEFHWKNLFNTRAKKIGWGIGVTLTFVIVLMIVAGIYTYTVAKELQTQGMTAKTQGLNAYSQFKAQNLPGSEAELKNLDQSLTQIQTTYHKLAFYRSIPFVGGYYRDGENGLLAADAGLDAALKAVEGIAPYADVLGFTGEEEFAGGTAEDRVKLMLETLEAITPQLDAIQEDLDKMNGYLGQIDENRYPQKFRDQEVRSLIVTGKTTAAQASTLLSEYRPIIEQLPSIAGAQDERRKYLVLFQNDNELRPTGGFLTAYAVIFIENGKVTPEKSDDIYELDQKFNERIAIPEELGRYLTTEKYFNLRDMNTSPDFKESMELFYEHYQDVPGEPDNIDGIIAVDTELLTELVRVVGPVEIPGYGTFTAENTPECDCPQVIYALSEIITRPTPYLREDRKGILAPLMQSILQRVYSAPRTYMADLFTIGIDSIEGRHLQMYFFDETNQSAVEKISAAGRLENKSQAEDFLAVVNANLGGAKSNLFIDYEMEQTVSAPIDGFIEKTVEITYKNDRKADNCNLEDGLLCLNSTLRDWTRIYVPAGSELISAQGFNEDPSVYEDEEFTVFDGFFILEPLGTAKLKLTYKVPYEDSQNYKLQMWKQGGITEVPVLMDVTGGQEEVLMDQDITYETVF